LQRIFVGDVQGCADELETLILRARAQFGNEFELWVAGDLVNRGPYNRRALELVRELVEVGRAKLILGNHDVFLIAVALGVWRLRPTDSISDVLEAADADEWIDWLRARPLVVAGEISGQPFAMVHAATHPAWSIDRLLARGEEISARLSGSRSVARDFLASEIVPGSLRDDLGRLTRCRSVLPGGGWSSEEPETPEAAWHAAWMKEGHEYGLVYGHWARQGLHFAPGLRGLDTGCVHHGRGRDGFLTAWLPDSSALTDSGGASGPLRSRPFDLPDDRIWQIPARRRYYDPNGARFAARLV
jgi:bis(5'-nucleosyl)-tetraphosphatase (symmetrical)